MNIEKAERSQTTDKTEMHSEASLTEIVADHLECPRVPNRGAAPDGTGLGEEAERSAEIYQAVSQMRTLVADFTGHRVVATARMMHEKQPVDRCHPVLVELLGREAERFGTANVLRAVETLAAEEER